MNQMAECFDEQRGRLRAVAYQILGSGGEAEDAVQEAWRGRPWIVLAFTIEDDLITAYDVIADPVRLQDLSLAVLD